MRQPVFQTENEKDGWQKLKTAWRRQPFVLKLVFTWVPVVLLIFSWITLEESLGIKVHHSQHKPVIKGSLKN